MTIGNSAKSAIAWSKETNYGEFAAPTKPMGAHQVLTPAVRANVQEIRQTGSSRDPAFLMKALQERSFTLDTYVVDGVPLALALEKITNVATSGSGTYIHTIDPAGHSDKNSLDSFTLEYGNEDLDTMQRYLGCMVNTLTLSCAGFETPLMATMDCIAREVVPLSWSQRAQVSVHTTTPHKHSTNQLQFNDTDFDGAVDTWNYRVSNALQAIPDAAGATDLIKYCLPGNRSHECTLTLRPNTKSLWEALINCTDQTEISFKYTRAANDTLEIVGYGSVKPNEGGLEHPADVGPINLPITLLIQKTKVIVTNSSASFY